MRVRIRPDANFSNLVREQQWLQAGAIYDAAFVLTKDRVVRVLAPGGRGEAIEVPAGLLERVE